MISAAAITAIEGLRQSGFAGAIITLSETLDEASVRGLLQLNVTDWLPADAPAEAIFQACQRASSARRPLDHETRATCVSFVPAAGGVGTTTLAIQTAFLLAKRSRNFDQTCLFDLNFNTGTMADYLDLKPVLDLGAIANRPERLDARLLEAMVARHPTGMAVIATPRAATEYLRVNGAVVTGAIECRVRNLQADGARFAATVAALDVRRLAGLRRGVYRHRIHHTGHAEGARTSQCARGPLQG